MTIDATLSFAFIGDVGAGTRLDVPFSGKATSTHWEGERPVSGVDYVTMRADGVGELSIRGRVGEGADAVAYQATGLNGPGGIEELFTFNTASESLAFLNGVTAVAIGTVDGDQLHLEVHKVVR